MIAPNKYLKTSSSLLGQASDVLTLRREGLTVSALWDDVRQHYPDVSYERFILCLDFLHSIGLVDIKEGTLLWPR